MLKNKLVILVSPSDSSFTLPVTRALKRLGAVVTNFYDDKPDAVARFIGAFDNSVVGRSIIKKKLANCYINKVLQNKLIKNRFDYMLVIKGKTINSLVIKQAASMGIQTINWFPDCQHIEEWIKKNADAYNFFFNCCLDMITGLKKINDNSFYLAYAGEADKELRILPKQYDVTFVGQYTKRREKYFTPLKTLGLNIWGYSGWRTSTLAKYFRGKLSIQEMKTVFRKSKIVVNMTTADDDKGFIAANLRNFEVTGVGTFLLSQGNEALRQLFTDRKEIVCFTNPRDLMQKASYYLAHKREREKIAQAGWEKTLKDHTYEKRLQEMFTIIDRSEKKT